MSLLDFLGAGNTVDHAHAAVNEIITKLDPLFRDIENRLAGIKESLLDRINGATIVIPEIRITLNLKPVPKAIAVEAGVPPAGNAAGTAATTGRPQ